VELAKLQQQKHFAIHQKITMMVNRYVVLASMRGFETEQVAFVEQADGLPGSRSPIRASATAVRFKARRVRPRQRMT
jgi:hypothetical protein